MTRKIALSLAAIVSLGACTHLGTNVSGEFACRAPGGQCEPLGVIDARATRAIAAGDSDAPKPSKPRLGIAGADTARTGERTLRVVFPAHVDGSGTLHEEAVAWAVVEAPRWAGELRRGETPKPASGARPLHDALRRAAQHDADTGANRRALSPEDGAPDGTPADLASPFVPASPAVLPSPAAEAETGASAPAAEGSVIPAPQDDRIPRPLSSARVWPSAEAIAAAQANKAAKDAGE